jgi:hypothetical protein
MRSSWPSNEPLFEGLDGNNNDIVGFLMEGCWREEPRRDYVLNAAIGATLGYMAHCQVLAYQFPTDTDERIVTTAKVVRQSEEVSRNTWLALRCWETGDLNDLHATVEACIIACEELYGNLVQYRPEMYSDDRDGAVSSDTLFDMWKTSDASQRCQRALEAFLVVWYEEKVPE